MRVVYEYSHLGGAEILKVRRASETRRTDEGRGQPARLSPPLVDPRVLYR